MIILVRVHSITKLIGQLVHNYIQNSGIRVCDIVTIKKLLGSIILYVRLYHTHIDPGIEYILVSDVLS